MERDSHKEHLPPPTAAEALVIEKVLNGCLHAHTERTVIRRVIESHCRDCGASLSLGIESDDPVSPAEEARRWQASLQRPATHLVVAERALAQVGRSGWEVRINQGDGSFVCTLTNGARIARSKVHTSRAAAIVDAIAQMATEYRFVG